MSDDGSLKLGALVGRLTMLEIACARCERRGRPRLDKLIARHGPGEIRADISGPPWNIAHERPRTRAADGRHD